MGKSFKRHLHMYVYQLNYDAPSIYRKISIYKHLFIYLFIYFFIERFVSVQY